jgi:hypothetical protein
MIGGTLRSTRWGGGSVGGALERVMQAEWARGGGRKRSSGEKGDAG